MNSAKRPYRYLLPGSFAVVFVLIVLGSFSSYVWATPGTQGTVGTVVATPVVTIVVPEAVTPVPTTTGTDGLSISAVVQPDQETTIDSSGQTESDAKVTIPKHAFTTTRQIVIQDVSIEELPALPAEVQEVRRAFSIRVYDTEGLLLQRPDVTGCIRVEAPYTKDDLAAAGGNPARLGLAKYDSLLGYWVNLTTRVALSQQLIRADVCRTLSTFAITVRVPEPTATPTATGTPTDAEAAMATATATAIPPSPGDISPSSNLLIGLMVAGAILVMSGAFYLRGSRKDTNA